MTTPVLIAGYEFGVATLTTNGGGLCSAISGTGMSVSSTVKRTGSYSLKLDVSAATAYITYTLATPTVLVGRVYFYPDVLSNPSLDAAIISVRTSTTSHMYFHYRPADTTWYCGFYGSTSDTPVSGVTITTGNWYRLDFRVNISADPWTLDWAINGVAQTQHTRALAASTITGLRVGSADSTTQRHYYDDLVLSLTSGDYPIGAGKVEALLPTTDGTHNSGTVIKNTGGTVIDGTSGKTAYTEMDEIPLGGGSDYVQQDGTGASNYAEVNFADTAETSFDGVAGYLAYHASGTQSNRGATVVIRNDATEVSVYGTSSTPVDMSESSLFYKTAIITAPSGGWTKDEVNALKGRVGYSTDANPVPYWDGFYLEVASKSGDATPTANDSGTLSDSASMSGSTPVTDSHTLSESVIVIPSATDSGTLSEVSLITIGVLDSGSLSESSAPEISSSVTDSATLSEQLSLEVSIPITDSFSLSSEVSGVAVPISATDSAALSESVAISADSSAGDSATLSELTSRSIELLDSATLSDSSSLSSNNPVSDSGSLSEAVSVSASTGVSDSLSFSEAQTDLSANSPVTDSASLSESSALVIVISDSFSLSESASILITSSVTDSFSLSESVQLNAGGDVSAQDSATLSESVSTSAILTNADSFALSETSLLEVSTSVTDSATLSDSSLISLIEFFVSDQFNLSESAYVYIPGSGAPVKIVLSSYEMVGQISNLGV